MPTIAALASATITIAAGDSLIFLTGGAGIAALQAGSTTVRNFQLGGSLVTVGPFDAPRTLSVSAERALTYSAVASVAPSEPRTAAIVGTPSDQVAFSGLVSGGGNAKTVLLASSAAGSTSGWVASASAPERFALQLVSGTAVVVIDGSNDGSTSAGVILTSTLDTVGTIQSTPLSHPYLQIRATHQSGVGVVNITRGA